jgi:hypothetical protein
MIACLLFMALSGFFFVLTYFAPSGPRHARDEMIVSIVTIGSTIILTVLAVIFSIS